MYPKKWQRKKNWINVQKVRRKECQKKFKKTQRKTPKKSSKKTPKKTPKQIKSSKIFRSQWAHLKDLRMSALFVFCPSELRAGTELNVKYELLIT